MKLKKRWIILLVLLVLIAALAVAGGSVMKKYLDRIERIDNETVDVIAPEDEFFDVDGPESADDQQGSGASSAIQPDKAGQQGSTDAQTPGTDQQGSGGTVAQPVMDGDTVVIDPSAVEWSFVERIEDDQLINILLIGQDGGWDVKKRQRADSMILCSINPETGKAALISFLRDTYVQIPGGYSDNRLNVPYVLGGFDLLDKTLETNFGITIDANVTVNFSGFEDLVDHLGGLEVDLSKKEVEYIERVWGLDVEEGINHLEGKYALNYVRMRKVDSDFGRASRQRTAILTLFNKVKGLGVSDLLTLLYDALPYLTTDLTDGEILSLAYRLLPLVPSLEIETHSVPSRGTYTNAKVRGMAVLLPDREKIRRQLAEEYLPLG